MAGSRRKGSRYVSCRALLHLRKCTNQTGDRPDNARSLSRRGAAASNGIETTDFIVFSATCHSLKDTFSSLPLCLFPCRSPASPLLASLHPSSLLAGPWLAPLRSARRPCGNFLSAPVDCEPSSNIEDLILRAAARLRVTPVIELVLIFSVYPPLIFSIKTGSRVSPVHAEILMLPECL